MIKLELSAYENEAARVFSITQAQTSIGRNIENDIVIGSSIMSGTHAEIMRADNGSLTIVDLGSINGTFVNDKQISKSAVKPGDELRFGNIVAVLSETRYPRKADQTEGSVRESSAIVRARQAMENLRNGLLSGASDAVKVESGAVREAAAAEVILPDTEAPEKVDDAKEESQATQRLLSVAQKASHEQARELHRLADDLKKITAERDQQVNAGLKLSEQIEELQKLIAAGEEERKNENSVRIQLAEAKQTRASQDEKLTRQAEEIQALQAALNEGAGDGAEREAASLKLKEALEQVVAERDSLSVGLAERSNDVSLLNGQLQQLQAQVEQVTAQLRAVEEDTGKDTEIANQVAEIQSLQARVADLQQKESELATANQGLSEQLSEASGHIAAKAAESEAYSARDAELQDVLASSESALEEMTEELTGLSELFGEKKVALREARERESALKQSVSKHQQAIDELKENLKAAEEQFDKNNGENAEAAAIEADALRVELDALTGMHGEIADAEVHRDAIRQQGSDLQAELESFQPERARLQQEMEAFQAQTEAAKAASLEEHQKVEKTLVEAQRNLEVLNSSVGEAQRKQDECTEKLLASTHDLKERQKTEADKLARLEELKVAMEQQVNEASLSTRAMELKREKVDSQIAKADKAVSKLHSKVVRRKKLLERLVNVGRRERELERKIKEGKHYLEAAEAHKPGRTNPELTQPWDVEQAFAERQQAIEEGKSIQRDVEAVKKILTEKQKELKLAEASIRKSEQIKLKKSAGRKGSGKRGRKGEAGSRKGSQLAADGQGRAVEVSQATNGSAEDDGLLS